MDVQLIIACIYWHTYGTLLQTLDWHFCSFSSMAIMKYTLSGYVKCNLFGHFPVNEGEQKSMELLSVQLKSWQ